MAEWLPAVVAPLASRFYHQWDQKEKVRRDERVAVIRQQQLIAAVRLSPRDGHFLVRALLVAPPERSRGHARALMQFVLDQFDRPLWCFVRPDLAPFYRSLGFVDWPEADTPGVILGPLTAYRRHQPLVLLKHSRYQ